MALWSAREEFAFPDEEKPNPNEEFLFPVSTRRGPNYQKKPQSGLVMSSASTARSIELSQMLQ